MAKRASDSPCASSAKKRKYAAKYQPEWATQVDVICVSDKGAMFAYCKMCNVNISFGVKYDVVRHSKWASRGSLKNVTKTQLQMKYFFVT